MALTAPPDSSVPSRQTEKSAQASVLLINQDPVARQVVHDYLSDHYLRVFSVSRLQDVTRQLAVSQPGLVILDLQLGTADGFAVLREIRRRSDVPIILLGDDRCNEMDRVAGLELGADDILPRPVGLRELLARVRAVLRRRRTAAATPRRNTPPRHCRFGAWQLDRGARRLTGRDGEPIVLTKGEYSLLLAFVDAPQRPLTREQLLQATRLHDDAVFDRSLDVQILRLRRKLETDPAAPRVIQTERGVGYMLSLPVEQF
ncbi:MAG: two-component system, OmpR family, response regulator [Solirubrobacterales bacterium]|nr:two-component system, OmpR family, response regulator [Solirubrobacterales bacterium]